MEQSILCCHTFPKYATKPNCFVVASLTCNANAGQLASVSLLLFANTVTHHDATQKVGLRAASTKFLESGQVFPL